MSWGGSRGGGEVQRRQAKEIGDAKRLRGARGERSKSAGVDRQIVTRNWQTDTKREGAGVSFRVGNREKKQEIKQDESHGGDKKKKREGGGIHRGNIWKEGYKCRSGGVSGGGVTYYGSEGGDLIPSRALSRPVWALQRGENRN